MNSDDVVLTSEAIAAGVVPGHYENYADEILVANGAPPRWYMPLAYLAVVAALAYFVYVRAFEPVNLGFAGLFIVWLLYTPIARRRGWYYLPL